MKTKHTPGPWIASCDDEETEEANVITANGVVIATVEDAPEIRKRKNKGRVEGPGCQAGADALDEVDANARLMAASPELFALAVEMESNWPVWLGTPEQKGFLDRLRATIAKAA